MASTSAFDHPEHALRTALAEADIVPALMVLVQLTDDESLLREAAPHITGAWNYQESLPPALKDRIRTALADALLAGAARGTPPSCDEETLRRRMSLAVGAEVPPEYVPLFREELGMAGADPRALHWRAPPDARRLQDFRVVIVGAGLSGICMGIRLLQAGIPFVILEKSADVGGTWHDNTYPGCGVDTPVHFYSYSFHPNPRWSRHFALRDEIQRYIEATVERFGLREHIRFGCDVQAADWDEAASVWRVRFRSAQGDEQLACQALVTAAGHNLPSTPRLPGIETFAGPVVHSAAWPQGLDLRGRRVAMVGTGASGMQIGPALAPQVERLTIFQRTPHWAMGNPNYHREIPAGQQWALEHVPFFQAWTRFLIFWAASDGFHKSLHMDPSWPQADVSLNADNHKLRETIIAYMRQELGGDEELLRKCTPAYPPFGKRLLRDNHWFRMLRRPNVDLVTERIERVEADAVLTRDGTRHAADALVFATGFHAQRLLWPMAITGRNGRNLRDVWGDDDPRAYKGMAVPGFPNLFVIAGPNTILAHGGSAIFHAECQVTWILQALREMVEQGVRSLEVREDVHAAYNERVERELRGMVWSHHRVTNWYKNAAGRVTMTSPWRLVDFWRLTRTFDPADFHVRRAAAAHQQNSCSPSAELAAADNGRA
jgi:4-hydroxyacetophenone monooxygenase